MTEGKGEATGLVLYNLLVKLSGIEKHLIEPELDNMLGKLNINKLTMNTEDMRYVLAHYLHEICNDVIEPQMEAKFPSTLPVLVEA